MKVNLSKIGEARPDFAFQYDAADWAVHGFWYSPPLLFLFLCLLLPRLSVIIFFIIAFLEKWRSASWDWPI